MPKKSSPKASPESSLAFKFKRHLRELELGKKHYQAADKLLAELSMLVRPGEMVKISDKASAFLVDNFAGGKIVFWGHGAVRRYEVDVIDK